MAAPDHTAEQWPIPKFHFSVTIDGETVSCQEVTGLKETTDLIEYRFGDDTTFMKQKIPGLKKIDNITIKKAMHESDFRLHEWYVDVQKNPERRKDLQIQLLNESGDPLMTWDITKAFPVSYTGPDLNSEGNELASESLEITHEGLTLS